MAKQAITNEKWLGMIWRCFLGQTAATSPLVCPRGLQAACSEPLRGEQRGKNLQWWHTNSRICATGCQPGLSHQKTVPVVLSFLSDKPSWGSVFHLRCTFSLAFCILRSPFSWEEGGGLEFSQSSGQKHTQIISKESGGSLWYSLGLEKDQGVSFRVSTGTQGWRSRKEIPIWGSQTGKESQKHRALLSSTFTQAEKTTPLQPF